jgi:two-component system chemotaxis response regulator CheB
MGEDGVPGLRDLYAAGGYVIAQDEASSIVYGMAREAVRAGVVHEILPLDRIAARLAELTRVRADA